jgi:hypothetical protein
MLHRIWLVVLVFVSPSVFSFDHTHERFAAVLSAHVRWAEEGKSSSVDYAALRADHASLDTYLAELSAVLPQAYERWTRAQQLAFLINAYNGFTLKLIIEHYPVASIRDIGGVWQSPWKRRFFRLLDQSMHLDQLEHELIRAPGVFDEPRIHFAVNCASVGCPALRPEPFAAGRLEQQLEDSTRGFLEDRSRNRFSDGQLEISSIFKWYREDFEQGWRGAGSLSAFLALYAGALGLNAETRDALDRGEVPLSFLDYNWKLNGL